MHSAVMLSRSVVSTLRAPDSRAVEVHPPEGPLAGAQPWRRLFLDAMVTEESEGLRRVFHQVKKHPGNPIVVKDRAWEGYGPYVYGTVLVEKGKFRGWYSCIGPGSGFGCYAESTDGIEWAKPALGLHDYHGFTDNNILGNRIGLASVIRLPKPRSRGRRYVVYGFGGGEVGPAMAFSADGIRWRWDELRGQLFKSSDVVNFFYDPYNRRYVSTYKTPNRRHRAVGVAYSENGLKWRKPVEGPVFGADDLDPDATQVYGMPVFPYQGLYIGLPWIYHARFFKYGAYAIPRMYEAQEGSPRTIDVELAWSWNLISWTRTPERKPFIPLGERPSWDWGMVFTARAPVPVGDELWFYFGGCDNIHDDLDVRCAIGLATLRLDGFCSMRAGRSEGWLISRREVFRTPRVSINVRTRADGYVVAELLDRQNRVIKGFSRKECIPFKGDSVRGTLSWRTKAFREDVLAPDKKIRFFLRNADLYSYLPEDIDTTVDQGSRKEH